MNEIMRKRAVTSGLVLAVVAILGLYGAVAESYGSVLPQGLIVSDTFKPGLGVSIGKIQQVRGEVIIVHAQVSDEGYRARSGLYLYRGDTVMTLEKSKVRFKLNDGSILSLASETRLDLNKSVYDKKKKSRSSFLNMAFGKARFLVVKLLSFKRSEFKVKTPTAICGVRGSDFVIEATAEVTHTTAFEDTVLEIISLVDPEAAPIVLREFETSNVFLGEYPTDPVKLPADEIRRMKEVFIGVAPGAEEQGEAQGDKAETETEVEDVQVLVSKDDIGELSDTVDMRDVETGDISDAIEQEGTTNGRSGGTMARTDLIEEAKEDVLIGDIPNFPGMPD